MHAKTVLGERKGVLITGVTPREGLIVESVLTDLNGIPSVKGARVRHSRPYLLPPR